MPRPNWYNDNRNRSFPFIRGTVGFDVPASGPVDMRDLPDDFIVDCGFVMGPESGYVEGTHNVFLRRVYRAGSTIFFEFVSDAPNLHAKYLTFSRDIAEIDYAVEFTELLPEAPIFSTSASISEVAPTFCPEFLWEGYLITGLMPSIVARLADGAEIKRLDGDAVVEPALIQNLDQGMLVSLELANSDRTRVTAPEDCPDIVWPYQTGIVFVNARCIQGDVRLREGYNASIVQNTADNTITIGAAVGSGAGEPCGEVPLFDGESSPVSSSNNSLAGGPLCNETLRSINGIGGPQFTILGGTGVSIVPDPDNHCIEIDVNLIDLALCISDFSQVSVSL